MSFLSTSRGGIPTSFYNLANLCKILGIKFNIAMLYLADEMLKNRHKTFTITIGKPIPGKLSTNRKARPDGRNM